MSQQHTQEPVAWRDGETGFVGRLKGGPHWQPLYQTLPYDHNHDAAARIAELEEYGRTRADEMLAATVRIADLEKQRDTLLEAYKQTSAIGRFCLSEDDCIVAGIDFSAYERGLSDAIEAFGKLFSAAITSVKEQA